MDTIDSARRSANMRRIRSGNTKPELAVRRMARALGHTGYRIHRKDLPGKPDLAWIGRKVAVFVHGCFWHGHDCNEGRRRPKSNQDYWLAKIENNQRRDASHSAKLLDAGWTVVVIWECEADSEELIVERLRRALVVHQPVR